MGVSFADQSAATTNKEQTIVERRHFTTTATRFRNKDGLISGREVQEVAFHRGKDTGTLQISQVKKAIPFLCAKSYLSSYTWLLKLI